MKRLLPLASCLFLILACETDSYEKGEGKYSLMQADFAELTVNSQKEAVAFTTDDGDSYQLESPFTVKWIETPDTVYRAIIYYNKVNKGRADPMAASAVPTLRPVRADKFKEQPQDPIGFESAWLATSGKYLNIGLLIRQAVSMTRNRPTPSVSHRTPSTSMMTVGGQPATVFCTARTAFPNITPTAATSAFCCQRNPLTPSASPSRPTTACWRRASYFIDFLGKNRSQ